MKPFKKQSSGDWKDKKRDGYKGGRSFSGGSGGGGGDWKRSGDRDSRPEMHRATCGQCNESCEVPFKPNGRRPVLCNNCFRGDDDGTSKSRYAKKDFDRRGGSDKPAYHSTPRGGSEDVVKQLKEMNTKMGKILDLLTDLAEDIEEDDEYEEDYEEDESLSEDENEDNN
ncbi:MAG: hypothetical protein Q8P30_01330 [Candidatus Uhrbacteria bacterium]|nr:hypothetical protein [Candidatus Uhrbacteria bacterium]